MTMSCWATFFIVFLLVFSVFGMGVWIGRLTKGLECILDNTDDCCHTKE